MPTDHTVCGPQKGDNIAKLKRYIANLIDESEEHSKAQQHVDRIEVAAWSRLLDEYIRGEFTWESIFPKAVVR